MFDRVCREHEIEHRFTKPNHPWTNGQVERMNRSLKEATIERYHYETHRQLKEHLAAFLELAAFLVMMTFVTSSLAIVAATAVIGIAGAVSMTAIFALPPFLSLPAEAPRTAAGMFTISYTCAIVIPTICGALWDLTGKPWTAFVPLCLCAVALAVLGTVVTRRSPAVQAAHG